MIPIPAAILGTLAVVALGVALVWARGALPRMFPRGTGGSRGARGTIILGQVLQFAVETGLSAVRPLLAATDPARQEATVRSIADAIYRELPDTIVVPLGGALVPLPLKAIVSAALFEQFVLTGWHGVEDLRAAILGALPPVLAAAPRTQPGLKVRTIGV